MTRPEERGPRLLERNSELETVVAAARAASLGEGSLLVIRGPIGNGKSTLLQAVSGLPVVRDSLQLRAGASMLEQDYAFGVVRQLLESVLGDPANRDRRERWLAGFGRLASAVFAEEDTDWTEPRAMPAQQATLAGLRALTERMSTETPVTILVDDLPWADEPSLRWLAQLADRLSGLRVLLVVTLRDGAPRSGHPLLTCLVGMAAHVLRPAPLTLAGAADFVREMTGERGDEEFVAALHETVGGNPFFLKAVLSSLARASVSPASDHVELIGEHHSAQMRDGVRACFHEQADAVGAVAKAMSVVGDTDDVELVIRVAGVDAIEYAEAMRVMRQLGFLVDRSRADVLHPLVRASLVDALPVGERERLHIRAAAALYERGHPAEQVALQLMMITSPQGPFAISALRGAAHTASRRGAPEVATRYLRRALLETSQYGEDRARVLVDLATVERAVDVSAAIRHICYAVPLLRQIRDRAAAMVRIVPPMLTDVPPVIRSLIGQISDELGNAEELRDLKLLLEARLRHIDYSDPAELADAMNRLSGLGAEPATDTAAERELLIILLYLAMLSAREPADEIARLGERVLERERAFPQHVHTAIPLLVTALAAAGSAARIGPWLERALENARKQGAVIEQALILTEQAAVALHVGRIGEARLAALAAIDLAALDWVGRSDSWSVVVLAAVAMVTRDPQLVELMNGHRDTWDTSGNACLVAVRQMLRGAQAQAAGDLPAALEHFLECGRRLERSGWRNPELFPWRLAAAEVAHQLGDIRTARRLAGEYHAQAQEWGTPAALGRAQRALGAITDGPAGVALLRTAVATLEKSVNRLELSFALKALADRLPADDTGEAGRHLRRARELAAECGCPGSTAPGAPRAGGAAERRSLLSPGEERVARLVSTGLGNQQTAQHLGVTVRAVEKHLTNIYRKLDIRGRTELAALFRTEPSASTDGKR